MHRITKFVEVSTGRIGYAMTEAAQSEVSNGAVWIRTLLQRRRRSACRSRICFSAESGFKGGYVMVPALKAKGK